MARFKAFAATNMDDNWTAGTTSDGIYGIDLRGVDLHGFSINNNAGDFKITMFSDNAVAQGINVDGEIYTMQHFNSSNGSSFYLSDIDYSFKELDWNFSFNRDTSLKEDLFEFADRIFGSHENDVLKGYDGDDILLGHKGADVISGDDGDDSMTGGSTLLDFKDGADTLSGGNGNDQIYGAGGDDTIYGGDGVDLLVGVYGNDRLSGGEGNDIFVMLGNGGYDKITDFEQGDIISIARNDAVQDYADVMSRITTDGIHSFISTEEGGGVLLLYTTADELGAEDFFFFG